MINKKELTLPWNTPYCKVYSIFQSRNCKVLLHEIRTRPDWITYDLFHFYLGNTQRYFSIDPTTGNLYVTKEIDREALPITNGDLFNLQIEAKQKDNPLKSTIANVSICLLIYEKFE